MMKFGCGKERGTSIIRTEFLTNRVAQLKQLICQRNLCPVMDETSTCNKHVQEWFRILVIWGSVMLSMVSQNNHEISLLSERGMHGCRGQCQTSSESIPQAESNLYYFILWSITACFNEHAPNKKSNEERIKLMPNTEDNDFQNQLKLISEYYW